MCWTPGEGVWTRALVGSLCCVPGQDTLLSQSLSPPRSVEGNLTNCWGGGGERGVVTLYGLASYQGIVGILLVGFALEDMFGKIS